MRTGHMGKEFKLLQNIHTKKKTTRIFQYEQLFACYITHFPNTITHALNFKIDISFFFYVGTLVVLVFLIMSSHIFSCNALQTTTIQISRKL